MLENLFKYPGSIPNAFDLELRSDRTWEKSDNRFLVINQHVYSEDLHAHRMLSTKENFESFSNFLKQSRIIARRHGKIPEFSYALVNYNAFKTKGLLSDQLHEAEVEFTTRITQLIETMQPTHVLICGTSAPSYIMKRLFPDVDHPEYKRGWIFEKDGTKYCSTLDLFKVISDEMYVGTVGFAFQHCSNLMLGYNPFSLADFNPTAKYVRTLKEFDQMMKILYSSKCVGCDTETKNLTVLSNKIYTIQFSSDKNPTLGYVLAIDHPQSHWSKEERVYIKKALQKFFYQSGSPFLITYNGMFDLRVIRQALHLPIINRECWELMAGEHDLDENVNDLTFVYGVPQGNLRACLCRYSNDFYFRNAFTKEDRQTIGDIAPDNKDFLMYGAADAAFMQGILKMQLKRSEFTYIGDSTYKPYFTNHMMNIMSATAHTLSHLKEDGSYVDMKYMSVLRSSKTSPLGQKARSIEQELFSFPELKKANDILCDREGFKAASLFGNLKKKWILSLSKPEHKQTLFFDVMKLKPVNISKKTGLPAVDKDFQEAYKYSNAIVSLYSDYTELFKLLNTYIKGWARMLQFKDTDAILDHRLRPDYAFYNVKTGRLGSRNPSLQVIPQRKESAQDIKRLFISPPGYLSFHYDYNAQEVRTWGIVAHDDVIADTFRIGQQLRQKYIKDPSDENKDLIKNEGDVHLLNVRRFFKRKVDKKHPLRTLVKYVIFGAIYQMSAQSMGEQIKTADIIDAKTKIHDAWVKQQEAEKNSDTKAYKEATKELDQANKALQKILEEDRTPIAQDMMDRMFTEFKKGKEWLDQIIEMAETYGFTMSPAGRIRHIPQVFVAKPAIQSKAIRQACNAPIQGFASELAVKASRLILSGYYSHFKEICKILGYDFKIWSKRIQVNRIVHDANYYNAPYEFVIPFLHIMQYQATYGVAETIYEESGFKFNIEPEIEIEVSTCDSDEGITWDWSIPKLLGILHRAVYDGYERGYVLEEPKSVMEKILKPWRNKECRDYLQKHYPLLGVSDLNDTIEQSLNEYDSKNANS